jgi:hypothetical protein
MRTLNVVDESSRECLRFHIDCQVKAIDAVCEIFDLFLEYGTLDFVRSDNGGSLWQRQYDNG